MIPFPTEYSKILEQLENINLSRNPTTLLLEPSHFNTFPVAEKVIHFILKLASNIKCMEIFVGEVNDLPGIERFPSIMSKEHPAFRHYPGKKTAPQWMFPGAELTNSFFFILEKM